MFIGASHYSSVTPKGLRIAPQWTRSWYPVQVNFFVSDVLPIYGYAVTRPLELQFARNRIRFTKPLVNCVTSRTCAGRGKERSKYEIQADTPRRSGRRSFDLRVVGSRISSTDDDCVHERERYSARPQRC